MRSTAALFAMWLVIGSTGCVSQADYDQLVFLNRRLASEKEQYLQEREDARGQADALRGQLGSKETEIDSHRMRSASLEQENNRLDEAVSDAHDIIRAMNFKPDGPVVIESVLPPELDAALRRFADSFPDSVEYDDRRGVVKWRSDLLFDSGRDKVKDQAKNTLQSFASVINSADANGFEIVVVGHTDNDPIRHAKARGHETNWHLAVHRSIAVARELIGSAVPPSRIGIMGYGEYRPLTSNDSTTNKARNRRVEIILVGRPEPARPNTIAPAQSIPAQPNK